MVHYPHSANVGSAIVAINCLKILACRHIIDFVGFKPETEILGSEGLFRKVELIRYRPQSRARRWLGYVYGILAGIPDSVSKYKSTEMRCKVEELLNSESYDSILVFELAAIQYCPQSHLRRVVANLEDPQSLKLARASKIAVYPYWKRWFFMVFARVARRYERRILPNLGKVLLLSAEDIKDMRAETGCANIEHFPYGVAYRGRHARLPYIQRSNAVIYSGNMCHLPNVDGALFLLNEVYPEILQRCPDVALWIVGAQPDSRIIKAAKRYGHRVEILSDVDDVGEYIKIARVSICPVRLRIGVQTKVIEAMSYGTPVVTTSAGNSGVGATAGVHTWVEDSPIMMATRVCDLLRGLAWEEFSQEGWNFVRDRFSWEKNIENFGLELAAFAEKIE